MRHGERRRYERRHAAVPLGGLRARKKASSSPTSSASSSPCATRPIEAGVRIVTGDTKVVEKGHGDGIFINTAGVGSLAEGVDLSGSYCKPGDAVMLSGTLGDHGIAVVSTREGLSFETDILTDAAPLNKLVAAVLEAAPGVRCFRDPTRGGLASTLNELAMASGVSMTVEETDVPVRPQVRGASEMLGYDVFQVANEGKMVAVVPRRAGRGRAPGDAHRPVRRRRGHHRQRREAPPGKVYVHTVFRREPHHGHARRGAAAEDLLGSLALLDRSDGIGDTAFQILLFTSRRQAYHPGARKWEVARPTGTRRNEDRHEDSVCPPA